MLLSRATGAEGDELDRALASFLEYYHAHMAVHTLPYDGIVPMMNCLKAEGLPMAILSNKPHPQTVELVKKLLASHRFEAVFGQRAGVALKPDPAAALEVTGKLGVDAGEVAFVGDSGVDMATAKAAGMLAVGVSWGLRDEPELHTHGADVVIHHPSALMEVLELASK